MDKSGETFTNKLKNISSFNMLNEVTIICNPHHLWPLAYNLTIHTYLVVTFKSVTISNLWNVV